MPVLIRSIHLMMLQSYIIIPEKQEKSVNACALFYGMCQNPNCVGRLHIIELCYGRCPQAYGQYDGPACQRVPGAGVENIGLSEISLNGKMVNYAAKYAVLQ